jgi:hypothetical protein
MPLGSSPSRKAYLRLVAVDCPQSLSEDGTNNDGDDDNIGNIEEQIPSVIPFP